MTDRLDDIERRLTEIEGKLTEIGRKLGIHPTQPLPWSLRGIMPLCGCPIGSVCGSTACPYRMEAISESGGSLKSIPIEGAVK